MFKLKTLSTTSVANVFIKNVITKFHTSAQTLAGHSKWANIKHTKALKDAQKSTLFTRMSRVIRLAVQEGGGINPELNTPLRVAVDEALKRNMPNSTIQGILKKCAVQTTKLKRQQLEIRQGQRVFMVVTIYTDNVAGAKMNIASVFKKFGSTYADTVHMFFDKGIIEVLGNDKITANTIDELEEIATEHAIESGAEELEIIDAETKHMTFICDPAEIERVKQKLNAFYYNVEGAEHVFIPNNPITLSHTEQETYDKFKEKIRNCEGVDTIYDNINIES